MSGTLATYWQKYKAISPWTAMTAYVATFVLWGIAFLEPQADRAVLAAVVIPTGMILDYVLHRLQTGKPNWQSALITSGIVTLLMPPDVNLGITVLAVALAIASKHFILLGSEHKRHVFNPAAFGVAVTAAVFAYPLGWWPDSFLWLTLVFGLLNVWRVKKFPQALSFAAVYVVLLTLLVGFPASNAAFSDLGIQSLPLALPVFFIGFMLPEPVTSLQPKWKQIQFGALAAVLGVAAGFVPVIAGAGVLWGLLAANVYAQFRR